MKKRIFNSIAIFSLLLFLFLLAQINQARALDKCGWTAEESWGFCDSSCDAGYKEVTKGTPDCAAENWTDKTCCIADPNNPVLEPSDTCTGPNGEAGECQVSCSSWMPGGEDLDDLGGSGCSGNSVETKCCGTLNPNTDGPGGDDDNNNTNAIAGTKIEIPSDLGLPDPGGSANGGNGIQLILLSFLNWLLIIFLIASLIAFVITGLMYLFAMGNSRSEMMDRAKNYFTYAVIALVITGSGLIIVNVVDNFLKASL